MSESPEGKLVFPEKVTISLYDSNHRPVCLAGVLLCVHAFVRRKNDFYLGPFGTDADGIATITKRELLAEVDAHYDSGLMDYASVEGCRPTVEIYAMPATAIQKAIEARSRVWTKLLNGEAERWSSIEELIATYRRASNIKLSVNSITVLWNFAQDEYRGALEARVL